MPAIKETADVRFSRDEALALLTVANTVLCDGESGVPGAQLKLATRALRRTVECFGGRWDMNAGAVAHDLHRYLDEKRK